MSRYSVTKALEFGRVEVTDPFVFLGRHNHGDIAILAANDDRLALGGVQKGGKALLRIGGGDTSHNV